MKRKLSFYLAAITLLSFPLTAPLADDDKGKDKDKSSKAEKAADKRETIDEMAAAALKRLLGDDEKATKLFEKSHAYAVFDSTKVALGVSGGGGSGVAVNRDSGERTYMKMGTAGVGIGIGAQNYQVIFLFQDEETFKDFVESGWEGEASAAAVAGKKGANAEATFTNGVAIYQLTKAGLMANADLSGTKYWRNKRLN